MTADHDLERRIADHYVAEAPAKAPGWVLEQLLASVEATPQRRTMFGRPWRIHPMAFDFARLGVAAVAVAAVGLAGLSLVRQSAVGPTTSAPPSPLPTLRPSPSAGYSRFDSTINNLSIDYPSGWQTRPATEVWTGGELGFDSPAADVIFDPALGNRLYLVLASNPLARLPDGTYFGGQDWKYAVLGWLCHGIGGEMWSVAGGVGGVRAEAYACGGNETGIFIETDTRDYFIRLVVSSSEPGLAETYGWDWLKPLLDTVDLHPVGAGPTAAVPSPSRPESEDPVPTYPNAVWSRGLDETFTSAIHGISLRYPSGWKVRPATQRWTDEQLTSESPAADVIVDPLFPAAFIAVASQPLALHPTDWGGPPPSRNRGGVCGSGGGGKFEVDGAKAFDLQCEGGGSAAIWTETRGYVIIAGAAEPEGRALFNAVLETVDLRPEEAVDAESPSDVP